MKYLLLILLFISCGVKAQYHIRVECFGERQSDPKYQDYQITFTNDNWKTKDCLMEAFDISDLGDGDINFNVCYQVKLFSLLDTSKQDAIGFAENFKTYQECIDFNLAAKRLYRKLLEYRKKHLMVKSKPVLNKNIDNCCKIIQIY